MMSGLKRQSYEAKFKLQVIVFADDKGNRAAGHEFSVSETIVSDWRKQKSKLKKLLKTKCTNHPGGKPHDLNWKHV